MADPNYISPAGAKRLSDELDDLLSKQRPKIVEEVAEAAAQGDRSENAEYKYGKRKLREIDHRIGFLSKRLEKAVLVRPDEQTGEVVFFGATVEIEDEDGKRSVYQLLGEDEVDPKSGKISWRSPLGRALLKRKVGDTVVVRRPAGEVDVEILKVSYI